MSTAGGPDRAGSDTVEVNFDGLVGPTHNYAGLSLGNRASMRNVGNASSPRQAARQGLAKMRHLLGLGLVQGVLPPHQRPDPTALVQLGFDPATPIEAVAAVDRSLAAVVLSASAMWAANAATVSPSADTVDGRVHLTPANLVSNPHRAFEASQTTAILRALFGDPSRFRVHPPLPPAAAFADEGAANHGRLTERHDRPGLQLFVFGREAGEPSQAGGFPRRQTRLAGQLIARSHGIDPTRLHFARQADAAIEAGAFHNDVVAVANESVLLAHEQAFQGGGAEVEALREVVPGLIPVVVPAAQVPLDDAITSYLFNSQLVTRPDRTMALIAPAEVAETPSTARWTEAAVADPHNPIATVVTFDLRESMRNGGGPACLRLRVVLSAAERRALGGRVLVDEPLLDRLERWVDDHYRDELRPDDLLDPALVEESRRALDELTTILELPGLYPFQR